MMSETILSELDTVAAIPYNSIQAGDTLVFSTSIRFSESDIKGLQSRFDGLFPGVRVLLLPPGVRLENVLGPVTQ